jgi:hypothetical protein
MTISITPVLTGNQALQAYQQIKQRGEQTKGSPESNAPVESLNPEHPTQAAAVKEPAKILSTAEQLAEQQALERSWGLIYAFVGTQVNVFV